MGLAYRSNPMKFYANRCRRSRVRSGPDTSVYIQILARRIAEAQLDLLRVPRHRLLSEEPNNPDYLSPAIMRKKFTAMVRFARAVVADKPLSQTQLKLLSQSRRRHSSWQPPCRRTRVTSRPWTAMSDVPFRDASLQFELSMAERHR